MSLLEEIREELGLGKAPFMASAFAEAEGAVGMSFAGLTGSPHEGQNRADSATSVLQCWQRFIKGRILSQPGAQGHGFF